MEQVSESLKQENAMYNNFSATWGMDCRGQEQKAKIQFNLLWQWARRDMMVAWVKIMEMNMKTWIDFW